MSDKPRTWTLAANTLPVCCYTDASGGLERDTEVIELEPVLDEDENTVRSINGALPHTKGVLVKQDLEIIRDRALARLREHGRLK